MGFWGSDDCHVIFVDSSVKIMDGLREHVETDVLALVIRDEIKVQIDPESIIKPMYHF